MKFNFPSDRINESNVASNYGHANEVGCFPIGRQFNWHGGIHIEGEGHPIRAIADGVIVAFRVPDYSIWYDGIKGEFSNSFILIQHKYTSPQGRHMIYYSLYMHLFSKFRMEHGDEQKIPLIFEDVTYKVKKSEFMRYEPLKGCKVNGFQLVGTIPKGKTVKLGNEKYTNNGYKYQELLSVDGDSDIIKYSTITSKHKIDNRTVFIYEGCLEFKPDGSVNVKSDVNIRCKQMGNKPDIIGHVLNGTGIEVDTDEDNVMDWQISFDKLATVKSGSKIKLGSKRYTSSSGVDYREILSVNGKSIKSLYEIGDKTVYIYESPTKVDKNGVGKTTKGANMRYKTVKYRKVLSITEEKNYEVNEGYKLNSTKALEAIHIDINNIKETEGGLIVTGTENGKNKAGKIGANVFCNSDSKKGTNWLDFLDEQVDIELADSTKKKKFNDYEQLKTIGGKTIEEIYGEGAKCYINGKAISVNSTCNLTDEQLATNDNPKVITGDNCCIPIKAGDIIGHAGDWDYLSGIYYKAAHIEVFSFDDPTEFIKGIEGDGDNKKDDTENTKDYIKIPECTDFSLKYPSSVKLEKDDVVIVDKKDGDYKKLKKSGDKDALTYWVKKGDLKTSETIKVKLTKNVSAYTSKISAILSILSLDLNFQEGDILEMTEDGDYYKVEKATMEREVLKTDFQKTGNCGCTKNCKNDHYCKSLNQYYPPKGDKFIEIDKKLNGLIKKTTMLTYVRTPKKATSEMKWRLVTFTAEDTGLFINKWDVKDEQEKEIHTLTAPITELYCMNPKGISDGSSEKDLVLKHNELPKIKIGEEEYYINKKNTNGLPLGLTVKQTKEFDRISPHNWEAFGFAVQKKEPKNFYFSKEDCQSSPFLKDAYGIMDGHMITEKGKIKKDPNNEADDEISKEELLMGIKSPAVQQKLSRMICFHTSEWAVDYATLESEVSALLDEKIKSYSGQDKKQLKEDKPRILELLENKLKALDFWTQVEVGQKSIDKQLERESKPKERETIKVEPIAPITVESLSITPGKNGEPDKVTANTKREEPATPAPQPPKQEETKATPEEKKKEEEEKALEEKLKFKPDQTEVYHFHPVAFVEQMQKMHPVSHGNCYCNRDFEVDEFRNIFMRLRRSEKLDLELLNANNCPLPLTERTDEQFVLILNQIMNKHGIKTCIQKIHFLTQIYLESARFKTTLEFADGKAYNPGKHKGAESMDNTEIGDGPRYKGRGFMQLTWRKNQIKYLNYAAENTEGELKGKSKTELELRSNAYHKHISDSLLYAMDSAGWFWSVYRKGGKKYSETKGKTLNEIALYGNKYLDYISVLVNGGSNGKQERRDYYKVLKRAFRYDTLCEANKGDIRLHDTSNVPWIKIAHSQLGVEEIYGKAYNDPQILEYHKEAGYTKKLMGREITDDYIGNTKDPWCGSFVYWCYLKAGISKTELNKTGYNAYSWKEWGIEPEKNEPCYGALAICNYSHVAFVVGKRGDKIVLLGGNQTGGDSSTFGMVCYSTVEKSKIIGYRYPKGFDVKNINYELEEISTDAQTDNINTTR